MYVWWEIVVYVLYGRIQRQASLLTVHHTIVVVSEETSLKLSRHVNWRIQAHVGSQETAVLAV